MKPIHWWLDNKNINYKNFHENILLLCKSIKCHVYLNVNYVKDSLGRRRRPTHRNLISSIVAPSLCQDISGFFGSKISLLLFSVFCGFAIPNLEEEFGWYLIVSFAGQWTVIITALNSQSLTHSRGVASLGNENNLLISHCTSLSFKLLQLFQPN